MPITLAPFQPKHLEETLAICNEIIEAGDSFPWDAPFTRESGLAMLTSQSATTVALDEAGHVVGFYILHPNNIGRAAHIANASYGVASACRDRGVGRLLVEDSLQKLTPLGFTGLQFNAVVDTNRRAMALYRKLGFREIGTIPKGFRLKDGGLVDIHIFYHGAEE